jgi:hypothetical protein
MTNVLGLDVCWDLLRSAAVGRLAVIVDDRPEIFPVNHVVDGGTIVLRTSDGTKLAAVLHDSAAAFEVDGYDESTDQAWSVIVKGQVRQIRRLHELLDTVHLPLTPWQGDPKDHFLRIEPDDVTGRRFPVAEPAGWQNQLGRTRRVASD